MFSLELGEEIANKTCSAIVNIDHVREIRRDGRSEGWVSLSSGERVRLSHPGWQKLIAMSTLS